VTAFFRRALRGCFGLALCVSAASCGGGGDTISSGSGGGGVAAANNVVNVAVTGGPTDTNSINVLYTTVTLCLPGTSTCQTIDNIQVDTGSYGLRILAPVLTLTFPVLALSNGSPLVECTSFVDGYSWGPVTIADVQISGESASSVPVQIIGDSRYPTVPTDCVNSTMPNAEDTVASFGANGLLGIGPFAQDCGDGCVSGIPAPIYYSCPTESTCSGTTVPLAQQVTNPVTLFATDNNGSIITLPSVATAGAATVSGSLIFGIDTESNNASGSETVVPVAASGYLTSIFNGSTLDESFIDSGSNAYFFSDSSLSTNSACQEQGFSGFYCPTSTTSLSGEMQLASGTSTVDFEIGNAEQISESFAAFPGLGGTNPTPNSFDWGLPFFYGRRVAIAIQGATTSAGTGPYIAY
jgi:hypothetical protein